MSRTGPRHAARPFLLAVLILAAGMPASVGAPADTDFPRPRPKPADPAASGTPTAEDGGKAGPAEAEATAEADGSADRPPFDVAAAKACEADLAREAVVFRVMPPSDGDGDGCGWPRPLEVSAVAGVAVQPPVEVRCEVGLALAAWLGRVIVPSAVLHLDGAKPAGIQTSGSYQCRRVNGSGRISEHATGNAVDVAGVVLDTGQTLAISSRPSAPPGETAFVAAIRGGACAIFTTVLGPGSDADHSDHIHVDLAARRSGYRLCQ